jgi:phosphoglycerol transferase MdoB-like AlkP superfamily enzyme
VADKGWALEGFEEQVNINTIIVLFGDHAAKETP